MDNMRRELSIAALSAASLLPLAGCEAQHLSAHPVDRAPTTITPTIVDLSGLPEILPPAVAALLQSVVRVEVDIKYNRQDYGSGLSSTEYEQSYGSGVRIRPDTYLTAGHVIRDKDGNLKSGINGCGSLVVDSATTKSTVLSREEKVKKGNRIRSNGTSLYAQQEAGSFTKNATDGDDSLDAALVVAPDIWQITPTFIPIELDKDGTATGDQVYLANFEPDSDENERSPNETKVLRENLPKGYNKPAVMGAVVLGLAQNGFIVAAEGIKSYDPTGERYIRQGSSGGPVFDAFGRLVGISVAIHDNKGVKAKDVFQQTEVNVSGVDTEATLGLVYIQPITKSILASLDEQLASAPKKCTYPK